jgi:biopolymer transport protein TolQ
MTLLENTGTVARVVLVLLALFSLWSWGIIISKVYVLTKVSWQSKKFWQIFGSGKSLPEIAAASQRLRLTPLVKVLNAGVSVLYPHSAVASEQGGLPGGRATSLAVLDRSMQRTATSQLTVLERRLTFLATTAAVAPFVGLFGTVWGVMTAFIGLASAENATIQAVAPGIAEALIATAFGLFAAIPAVIAYNQFLHRIRNVAGEMDELQADILVIAETGA